MAGELWLQQVRDLLAQQQKIQAIRLVRQQTGCGLKDAKDFVDAIERGQNPPVPSAASPPSGKGCAVVLFVLILILAGLLVYFRFIR